MDKRKMHLDGIQAVISDWDDTITESFEACCQLYNSFATYHDLELPTKEKILPHFGIPVPAMIAALWPGNDLEDMHKKFITHADEMDFSIKPFPGSKEAILKLKRKNYLLGVLSSGPHFAIDKTLERYLKLPASTFSFILGAEDTPVHKPDPRVFDKAFETLKHHGITEKHSLYVGDTLRDFKAAKERGMVFFGVTTGFTTRESFTKAGLEEEFILSSFSELPNLIS